MKTILHVDNISKAYGDFWAVSEVSFSLKEGQLVALIGPNGAGKTTTFNMIGGQTKANQGHVWFIRPEQGDKVDLLARRSDEICALGIGRTFQIAEIFSSLTVIENVQLALQAAHQKEYVRHRTTH